MWVLSIGQTWGGTTKASRPFFTAHKDFYPHPPLAPITSILSFCSVSGPESCESAYLTLVAEGLCLHSRTRRGPAHDSVERTGLYRRGASVPGVVQGYGDGAFQRQVRTLNLARLVALMMLPFH